MTALRPWVITACTVGLGLACASGAARAEGPTVKVGAVFTGAVHFDTNDQATRPWLTRVEKDEGREVLLFDIAGSRLQLSAEARHADLLGRGFVETDFKGPSTGSTLRLRHAFVALESPAYGLLLGQTWTLIGMHGPSTFNWDWMFFQGNPYNRVPQLRVMRRLGDLTVMAGAFPSSEANGSKTVIVDTVHHGKGAIEDSALPILQARAETKMGDKGFLAVAGAAGRVRIVFAPTDARTGPSTGTIPSYLATLDASIPVGRARFSGKLWYSLSGGYNSAAGQIAVIDSAGRIAALPARGGWLDLAIPFHFVNVSAYAAVDDPDDFVGDTPVGLTRNMTAGGTLAREVLPGFTIGAEAQWARSEPATQGKDKITITSFDDLRVSLVIVFKP